jgi:putative aminopeptidase FrvX
MPIPPLLDELLRGHGTSGHEDAVRAIVRRETAAIGAELEKDVLGSETSFLR